ncbi:unnamed protein product, partial [Mesorhabditis belari]|uniref:Uncharacterized protein n=1 Tax=Mesorhabditis belari TaxID=2138241 RepID=A0AAF3FEL8_9BILA
MFFDHIFEDLDDEPEEPPQKRWSDASAVFNKYHENKSERMRRPPERAVQDMINVFERTKRLGEMELMENNRAEIIDWLHGIEDVPEPSNLEGFLKKACDRKVKSPEIDSSKHAKWSELSEVIFFAAHNTFVEGYYARIDYENKLKNYVDTYVRDVRAWWAVDTQRRKNRLDQVELQKYKEAQKLRAQQRLAEMEANDQARQETTREILEYLKELDINRIVQGKKCTVEKARVIYQESMREKDAREEKERSRMIVASPPRNEEEYEPIEISIDYDDDDMNEQLDSEDEEFRNEWAEVENECPEEMTTSTRPQPSVVLSHNLTEESMDFIESSVPSTSRTIGGPNKGNRREPEREKPLATKKKPLTDKGFQKTWNADKKLLYEGGNAKYMDPAFDRMLAESPETRWNWSTHMKHARNLLMTIPTKSCLRKITAEAYADLLSSENVQLRIKFIERRQKQKRVNFQAEDTWSVRIYTPSCDFDKDKTGWGQLSHLNLMNARDTGHTLWFEIGYQSFRDTFGDVSTEVFPNKRLDALKDFGGLAIDQGLIKQVDRFGLFQYWLVPFPYASKAPVNFLVTSNHSKEYATLPGTFMEQASAPLEYLDDLERTFHLYCFPRFDYAVYDRMKPEKILAQNDPKKSEKIAVHRYGYAALHAIITDSALAGLNSEKTNAVVFLCGDKRDSFRSWTKYLSSYNRSNEPIFPRNVVCCLGVDYLKKLVNEQEVLEEEEKDARAHRRQYRLFRPGRTIQWKSENERKALESLKEAKITFASSNYGRKHYIEKFNKKLTMASICEKVLQREEFEEVSVQELVYKRISTYAADVFGFALNVGHVLQNEKKLAQKKGLYHEDKPRGNYVIIMQIPPLEPIAEYAKIFNNTLQRLHREAITKNKQTKSFLKLLSWPAWAIPERLTSVQTAPITSMKNPFGRCDNGSIDLMYQGFREAVKPYIRFMDRCISYAEWEQLMTGDEKSRFAILERRPMLQKAYEAEKNNRRRAD